MEVAKHFTATTIIIHKGKALLHLHKKLGMRLPMGGHIEPNELPQETALREIREECGLQVILYNPDKQIEMGDTKQLIRPTHLLLENIQPLHQHIDFIYYATANTFETNPQDGETKNLQWFTSQDIEQLNNTPKNVKICALEAIELLS